MNLTWVLMEHYCYVSLRIIRLNEVPFILSCLPNCFTFNLLSLYHYSCSTFSFAVFFFSFSPFFFLGGGIPELIWNLTHFVFSSVQHARRFARKSCWPHHEKCFEGPCCFYSSIDHEFSEGNTTSFNCFGDIVVKHFFCECCHMHGVNHGMVHGYVQ